MNLHVHARASWSLIFPGKPLFSQRVLAGLPGPSSAQPDTVWGQSPRAVLAFLGFQRFLSKGQTWLVWIVLLCHIWSLWNLRNKASEFPQVGMRHAFRIWAISEEPPQGQWAAWLLNPKAFTYWTFLSLRISGESPWACLRLGSHK